MIAPLNQVGVRRKERRARYVRPASSHRCINVPALGREAQRDGYNCRLNNAAHLALVKRRAPLHGEHAINTTATYSHQPWNKGKLVGQKAPLRLRDIWAFRVRHQIAERTRDLALFDMAIDSKLRACVPLGQPASCDIDQTHTKDAPNQAPVYLRITHNKYVKKL